MKGKSITIRTVDLGVDKNPRWFGQNSTPNGSLNPALGLTGIRLCLAEPVMFRTQMRAILPLRRPTGPYVMMWPMITSISEVRQCLIHLDTAQRQLTERGETFGPVSIGCMIEIPSAAMTVGSILKLVDFVSIGTNDLIQYLLSVDAVTTASATSTNPATLPSSKRCNTLSAPQTAWKKACPSAAKWPAIPSSPDCCSAWACVASP